MPFVFACYDPIIQSQLVDANGNPLGVSNSRLTTETSDKLNAPFYGFLTLDGTAAGDQAMNGDYSVTPEEFYIKPASTEVRKLLGFTVHIHDNAKFVANGYGAGIALANGIRVILARGTDLTTDIIAEFTITQTIKTHGAWTQFGGILNHIDFGAGDDFVSVLFRLNAPVIIDGTDDQLFGVILNDDFSHLVTHTAFASGVTVS